MVSAAHTHSQPHSRHQCVAGPRLGIGYQMEARVECSTERGAMDRTVGPGPDLEHRMRQESETIVVETEMKSRTSPHLDRDSYERLLDGKRYVHAGEGGDES
ncbi:hypothetical protein EVAR_53344_1 [Eumeta japonica]|uniref:Uncharacterized protein n=1 Tax=Eumeta variegata TaxID=151549 RepID=A0A4C1YGN5_EUMVA|nr:hypothetical protein EVAR_53344_1 [Eumeta japonica]